MSSSNTFCLLYPSRARECPNEKLEELPEEIPLLQQVMQHAEPELQEKLLSLCPKQNLATIPDSKFGNHMTNESPDINNHHHV